MLKRTHTGDTLVVAVVVKKRHPGYLCGSADQQIYGRHATMVAIVGGK